MYRVNLRLTLRKFNKTLKTLSDVDETSKIGTAPQLISNSSNTREFTGISKSECFISFFSTASSTFDKVFNVLLIVF